MREGYARCERRHFPGVFRSLSPDVGYIDKMQMQMQMQMQKLLEGPSNHQPDGPDDGANNWQ
jgi:hypothetical protein